MYVLIVEGTTNLKLYKVIFRDISGVKRKKYISFLLKFKETSSKPKMASKI
jgi:hypothetical protein